MHDDKLTNEAVRQVLSEMVPGFSETLAKALGIAPADLYRRIEGGELTKTTALAALAKLAISLYTTNEPRT